MELITILFDKLIDAWRDLIPIILAPLIFQILILRRPIPMLANIGIGFVAVAVGLTLFSYGLELGVFPLGESLARDFSYPDQRWRAFLFAFCIGYATTVAEPSLIAIALKAEEISTGAIKGLALRNAVALGVAVGVSIGVWRVFSGGALWSYILIAYVLTLILTFFAPREIIPIAYDSGGVTTSTITVPILAALGLGLASNTPGRDPLIDGFGLIAFASVFPIISTLGYSILARVYVARSMRRSRR